MLTFYSVNRDLAKEAKMSRARFTPRVPFPAPPAAGGIPEQVTIPRHFYKSNGKEQLTHQIHSFWLFVPISKYSEVIRVNLKGYSSTIYAKAFFNIIQLLKLNTKLLY